MSVRIIADSTADLTPAVRARVRTVPICILFGEEEYWDGVNIDSHSFYTMLARSEILPTTSQPTPAAFEEIFRETVAAGDQAVCITISSELSGTYQSAAIAAQEFSGQIFVVDSRTVALGAGILTEYALALADRGLNAGEISRALEEKKGNVRLYAIVDTLEYLKKGGRLSAASALVGGLLNIKPILCTQDGGLKVLGSVRGMKKAFAALNEACGAHGGVDRSMPVLLGYTGQSGEQLEKYIADSDGLWTLDTPASPVGAAVGVHAGPGAVAVAFFSQE